MTDREKLILERYRNIKERGLIKYSFVYGSMFGLLIFALTVTEVNIGFNWYEWLVICFVCGLGWASVMWLFVVWQYNKRSHSSLK